MNWVGDWIQNNIDENDTVLDLGCGIMQATLDIVPTYPKTKLKCKSLFGVDIYQPYLDVLDKLGIKTLKWDLTKVPYPFEDKSFDHIILTDIIEHLPSIETVNALIEESKRIARKKLFVLTPSEFFDNISTVDEPPHPYNSLGSNVYQEHKLFIEKDYLERHGFKVHKRGIHYVGLNILFNKILHVWDCAGVSGLLSKYQNRMGYESKVFIGNKVDVYGFDRYYNEVGIKVKPFRFPIRPPANNILSKVYRHIRFYIMLNNFVKDYDPDIIHFHAMEFIPLLFPFKKKIVEFHGTRLRRKWADGSINKNVKTPQWIFRFYKLLGIECLYSTSDLIDDIPNYINATYLPNPVDIEHFKEIEVKNNGYALYSINHYEDAYKRLNELKDTYEFTFIEMLDRKKGEFIKYEDMPNILKKFEFYIDRNNIKSLSKTALESLAMGIKVVDWNNNIIEGLTSDHYPDNVSKLTLKIYDEIVSIENPLFKMYRTLTDIKFLYMKKIRNILRKIKYKVVG